EETLDYILREMTDPAGGFYSAQDADSEGHEGKFFVWSMEELREALGETDARAAAQYWGVDRGPNFEGKNILSLAGAPDPERIARWSPRPWSTSTRRRSTAAGSTRRAGSARRCCGSSGTSGSRASTIPGATTSG